MNPKIENKYYLKIPSIFLEKFWIDPYQLKLSVKDYIYNFYLKNKQKVIKTSLQSWEKINLHKIQVSDNNRSWKKSKRVLIIILINNPRNGINTVFPVFAFSTQEEKKYTTQYLKTKEFWDIVLRNFKKYKDSSDINWNKINETLWIELINN